MKLPVARASSSLRDERAAAAPHLRHPFAEPGLQLESWSSRSGQLGLCATTDPDRGQFRAQALLPGPLWHQREHDVQDVQEVRVERGADIDDSQVRHRRRQRRRGRGTCEPGRQRVESRMTVRGSTSSVAAVGRWPGDQEQREVGGALHRDWWGRLRAMPARPPDPDGPARLVRCPRECQRGSAQVYQFGPHPAAILRPGHPEHHRLGPQVQPCVPPVRAGAGEGWSRGWRIGAHPDLNEVVDRRSVLGRQPVQRRADEVPVKVDCR